MSLGLLVNLAICVCSLLAAWTDHGESYATFRGSAGKERRRKGVKFGLLWIVPALSLIALPITWWESTASEQKIAALQPKPLKERVMTWLASLGPGVMERAKQGHRVFEQTMTVAQKSDLQHLCAEDQKARYIRQLETTSTIIGRSLKEDVNAKFMITEELLK